MRSRRSRIRVPQEDAPDKWSTPPRADRAATSTLHGKGGRRVGDTETACVEHALAGCSSDGHALGISVASSQGSAPACGHELVTGIDQHERGCVKRCITTVDKFWGDEWATAETKKVLAVGGVRAAGVSDGIRDGVEHASAECT